jgi:hypothetical protein
MRLHLSSFAAAITVACLSPLSGCSSQNPESGTGGSGAGGAAAGKPGSGGTAGVASGGVASGGKAAGGVGGSASAGKSGAGSGGQSTGGSSGSGGAGGRGGAPSGGQSAGGVGAAGASSGGSGGDAIPATFATFKFVMMGTNPPCSASDCHGVGGPNPLQMPTDDDATLYTNLTTVIAKECKNIPVITKGNPAQSALVTLINGPCDQLPQMPKGCTAADGNCVPDDYIAAITQWIANGAPQN